MRLRELELRLAIASRVQTVLSDGWFLHARGKYSYDVERKIIQLQSEAPVDEERKGAFVEFSSFGTLTAGADQEVGELTRPFLFKITVLVPYNDTRSVNQSSYDYIAEKLDFLVEAFDLDLGLGYSADQVMHTGLTSLTELGYVDTPTFGKYHVKTFTLEVRTTVTVGYCQ